MVEGSYGRMVGQCTHFIIVNIHIDTCQGRKNLNVVKVAQCLPGIDLESRTCTKTCTGCGGNMILPGIDLESRTCTKTCTGCGET